MDSSDELKTAVIVSRKWDGGEIAEEIKEKIQQKNVSPKFILLFLTIHHEPELLKIIDQLMEAFPGIPVVGGTLAGFITQEGCFTRGVAAFAMDSPSLDVAIGYGLDTKKNPKRAADNCADMLLSNLEKSDYSNTFIFQFTSGATIPHFPGVGSSFVLKGKIKSSLAATLIETSTKNMQRGIGREEEVLEELSKKIPDAYIIAGSSSDDMSLAKNIQFVNKNIFTNAVVALAIKTNHDIQLKYNHGFHKLDHDIMRISDGSFENRIVKKINNKEAISEFTQVLGWSEPIFNEIINRKTSFYNLPTIYFPLGFEYPDGVLAPAAVGAILGKGFSFNYKISSDNLYVLTATGRSIADNIIKCADVPSNFTFGISCCGNLVTLGDDVYIIQKELKKKLDQFFIGFTLGEGVYSPTEKIPKFFNEENILMTM
jgi:hypothetical protein